MQGAIPAIAINSKRPISTEETQLSAKMQRINLAGTKGGFAEKFNGVMQNHLSCREASTLPKQK